jgi:hypothetical protein
MTILWSLKRNAGAGGPAPAVMSYGVRVVTRYSRLTTPSHPEPAAEPAAVGIPEGAVDTAVPAHDEKINMILEA